MKYVVHGMVTVSCWTHVEADSPEEAREIAEARELADLCHGPFDVPCDEAFHFTGDGTAYALCVEEGEWDEGDMGGVR